AMPRGGEKRSAGPSPRHSGTRHRPLARRRRLFDPIQTYEATRGQGFGESDHEIPVTPIGLERAIVDWIRPRLEDRLRDTDERAVEIRKLHDRIVHTFQVPRSPGKW